MIKIMLVDDEVLIRDLIKNRIRWAELGMEIVCEASSAREALALVERYEPDIIITDICMPVMDGIELSAQVLAGRPHVKIVVLTGHEEFEYAKRSINAGISDFLLKPINGQEIERVALKLKEKLGEENSKKRELEALKKRLTEHLPFLKEKFLHELVHQDIDSEELKESLAYYHLNFQREVEHYQIAILEAEGSDLVDHPGEEQRLLFGLQCKDLIDQHFKDYAFIHSYSENDKRIVLLCNDPTADMVDCCESIKGMLIDRLPCVVNIGIGNRVGDLKNLKHSYKNALEALEYKIIVGKNQVVSYDELVFLAEDHAAPQPEGLDQLKFYIKTGLADKAQHSIEELFKEFGNMPNHTLDGIRLVALDAVSACLHVLNELGINHSAVWVDRLQPFQSVLKSDTLPEIKQYLKEMSLGIIAQINGLNTKKVNIVVRQIKEHLADNMADAELSPSGIAKAFYLNQSHLSRLFKQETGQTFVEYLTRIRLEKAIELLKQTDMKVYQIGEKVGIPDPHYFSIVFKKFTGKSINDYRKM
ncbi:response regulator [Cohnella yongneupensis]|uniref:Response regulator n=1 Tax=Cohnella yongneupensis TaxID=425006 RepID=A0ABW0R374_9BACL